MDFVVVTMIALGGLGDLGSQSPALSVVSTGSQITSTIPSHAAPVAFAIAKA